MQPIRHIKGDPRSKKIMLILLALLSFAITLPAQVAPDRISFGTTYLGNWVAINDEAPSAKGSDSVVIEKFRFYVSDVELMQDDQVVARALPQYRLVDIEYPEYQVLRLESTGKGNTYNHLRFKLGIDSLTNVSGAMGGDLDPAKGMYWAWQSGYVNMKIEGTSPKCPARNHRFQYHLGGYQAPNNALQIIDLPLADTGQTRIKVRLPLENLLPLLHYDTDYEIMSPSAKAVDLSRMIASLFYILP